MHYSSNRLPSTLYQKVLTWDYTVPDTRYAFSETLSNISLHNTLYGLGIKDQSSESQK